MTSKHSILVVDDDPEMRNLLGDFLTRRGYHVITAASGDEAIAQIQRDASRMFPDLVVSDIRMGPMNGLELLKRLTSERPSLPVLLVSAFGDRETARGVTAMGARGFFTKPFGLGEIDRAIRNELARHPKTPGRKG